MELAAGSYHVGGAHVGLCDGAVRFLSETVDQQLLEGLGSRAGNDVAGRF